MAVVTENDIKTAVKNNNYSRAYYFYGKDAVAVEKYTKALSARLVSKDDETYNLHSFDGKNLDIELLADSCEALPMFSDYVCCVVSDLNAETLTADQLNSIIDVVKNLPESTVLIFYYTSVDVTDGKKYPTTKNKKLMEEKNIEKTLCRRKLQNKKIMPRLLQPRHNFFTEFYSARIFSIAAISTQMQRISTALQSSSLDGKVGAMRIFLSSGSMP